MKGASLSQLVFAEHFYCSIIIAILLFSGHMLPIIFSWLEVPMPVSRMSISIRHNLTVLECRKEGALGRDKEFYITSYFYSLFILAHTTDARLNEMLKLLLLFLPDLTGVCYHRFW